MTYKVIPKTYDVIFGPAYYCTASDCRYRESGAVPFDAPTLSKMYNSILDSLTETDNRLAFASQITQHVVLGDLVDVREMLQSEVAQLFSCILNVSNESYSADGVNVIHIPLDEFDTSLVADAQRRENFLRAVSVVDECVENNERIFVHCAFGANRSPAVVIAHLINTGMSFSQAYNYVKSRRPIIFPHGLIFQILYDYAKHKNALKTEEQRIYSSSTKTASDTSEKEFLQQIDWNKPFELNYVEIVKDDEPIEKLHIDEQIFVPTNRTSERFVRADILISQALEHYRAQQFPAGEKGVLYDVHAAKRTRREELISRDLFPGYSMDDVDDYVFPYHPKEEIRPVPPDVAYKNYMSKRGLVVPAPHVFNSDIYQNIISRAPMLEIRPDDPNSIEKVLLKLNNIQGALVYRGVGDPKDRKNYIEYVQVPTNFGGRARNHIAYSSWFAVNSPNTAVVVEELLFVIWQAGQSSSHPLRPGLLPKNIMLERWLQFLRWAGYPDFKNLYQVVEGFDRSDDSYERRLTTISRLPGFQPKVASFFLALMGDTRSPTIDMHALSYLINKGDVEIPNGSTWSPLDLLAEKKKEVDELFELAKTDSSKKSAYQQKRAEYIALVAENKKTIVRILSHTDIEKIPPKTKRGIEGEKKRIREYIRRQLVGWDGNTDTFWGWYASNPEFKTHEPRRNMIHTVFFQSLFPELFTPQALASRPWVIEIQQKKERGEYVSPEEEDRTKYRNYLENLKQIREIQKPEPDKKEENQDTAKTDKEGKPNVG